MDKRRKPAIREPRPPPHYGGDEILSHIPKGNRKRNGHPLHQAPRYSQDDYRYPRSIGQGIHHQSR